MPLHVTADSFRHGEEMPRRHTCEGADVSPALQWTGAPDQTHAFALICADPDAPGGTFYHWGLWGLPVFMDRLPEGYGGSGPHLGVHAAVNDFGSSGYRGPCPPHGHGRHHYRFIIYALDTVELPTDERLTCKKLEALARRHALATGEVVGTFAR